MRRSLIPSLAWLAALVLALAVCTPAQQAAAGPTATLTITVKPGSAPKAAGAAPAGFPLHALARRVPGIDLSGVRRPKGRNTAESWARTLDAVSVVLPRLGRGELRLSEHGLAVEGRLRPGFNAEATRGAVRLALGSERPLRLDIADAPPSAALAVTWSRAGMTVSGILPGSLEPAAALALLRKPVERVRDVKLTDAGLTSGGGGDAAAWRKVLARVGQLLPAYRSASVRVAPGRLTVDGTLMPGEHKDRLGRWMADGLDHGWQVSVNGSESPAGAGATRYDPVSGRAERHVGKYWIPLYGFKPSPASCGKRSSAVLAASPLTFVPGTTTLTGGAGQSLDRLAGIARRCLNDGGLKLEIGGHTDNVGAADRNQLLSQKRAMAVLLALVVRGVRADAMHAAGYGETRPVASNDTAAGRARNRRITFAWSN